MPRGGRRSGKQGAAYTNRSDLQQAPRAAKGQEYGKAQASLDAQRSMPLPAVAGPPTVPIHAPTTNPGEPITAGMPMGAGPGPTPGMAVGLDPASELRAIYQMFPNDDLAELLSTIPRGGMGAR